MGFQADIDGVLTIANIFQTGVAFDKKWNSNDSSGPAPRRDNCEPVAFVIALSPYRLSELMLRGMAALNISLTAYFICTQLQTDPIKSIHSIHSVPTMLEFRTQGFNGYAVKYSPFFDSRIAVASAANFGLVGNGRLYILNLGPDGISAEKWYLLFPSGLSLRLTERKRNRA